jgi:two-component sensor histidine kinase
VFAFVAIGILASVLGAWATESQVRARLAAEREIEARTVGEERRKLLLDELNHRVKNTLATVQSIAAQSLRNAPDLESGRKDFEARLLALSEAHNLLTRDNWRGASLADLAATELVPYGGEGQPQRVTIFGEPVWLRPNTAVALGMAFHELATNAAKYGALSGKNGQVKVSWTVSRSEDGPDRVCITWREAGGPPVKSPSRRGFGSRLIVSGLAHQLNGDVKLDFDPDGVRCSIAFNLAPGEAGDARAA